MRRGSSDNISIIAVALSNPEVERREKKGNEHIKIMSLMKENNSIRR
jgi:hypothetical protein